MQSRRHRRKGPMQPQSGILLTRCRITKGNPSKQVAHAANCSITICIYSRKSEYTVQLAQALIILDQRQITVLDTQVVFISIGTVANVIVAAQLIRLLLYSTVPSPS